MQYWLMKTEPHELSISDLMTHTTLRWDGVRGYEARNFMRDMMQSEDLVVIYHSGILHPGPVGLAEIASPPYPDPTQFDSSSPYFDPTATREHPRWVAIDVRARTQFSHPITRAQLRAHPDLTDMVMWKKFRLSVIPLTPKEYRTICALAHGEDK